MTVGKDHRHKADRCMYALFTRVPCRRIVDTCSDRSSCRSDTGSDHGIIINTLEMCVSREMALSKNRGHEADGHKHVLVSQSDLL